MRMRYLYRILEHNCADYWLPVIFLLKYLAIQIVADVSVSDTCRQKYFRFSGK